ncbi:MAG TPA: hypothetical protein VHM92_01430 [Allosphingosinicella sp.]|nr:hypothetical protein [Allosphingosinicella sp.]
MRPLLAFSLLALAAPVHAARPDPVIDMHLHALAADEQGPPPLAICAPFDEFPGWDQQHPYTDIFLDRI